MRGYRACGPLGLIQPPEIGGASQYLTLSDGIVPGIRGRVYLGHVTESAVPHRDERNLQISADVPETPSTYDTSESRAHRAPGRREVTVAPPRHARSSRVIGSLLAERIL